MNIQAVSNVPCIRKQAFGVRIALMLRWPFVMPPSTIKTLTRLEYPETNHLLKREIVP